MLARRARDVIKVSKILSTFAKRRLSKHDDTSLNAFERSIYSQNGEDGLLEELFRRIGTTDRFAVEFGVEDGTECTTAYPIRHLGWSGLLMEGDPKKASALARNYRSYGNVGIGSHFITADNIISIFQQHGVPEQFDLLSIDVDGNDYWLWVALAPYRPRVVVIEYNSMYPPPIRWIMSYNARHEWDGTSYHGASLTSLAELGSRLGYGLVATDSRGVNAVFVREDVLASTGVPSRAPEAAYHAPNFGLFYKYHPFRTGPFVTENE